MGMSVFGRTRKRQLVEMLHDHGISISYNRVLEVSAQLGDAAVAKYEEDGVVCQPDLRTSISIFQHQTTDNEGEKREPLQLGDKRTKTAPELPDSYANSRPKWVVQKWMVQ